MKMWWKTQRITSTMKHYVLKSLSGLNLPQEFVHHHHGIMCRTTIMCRLFLVLEMNFYGRISKTADNPAIILFIFSGYFGASNRSTGSIINSALLLMMPLQQGSSYVLQSFLWNVTPTCLLESYLKKMLLFPSMLLALHSSKFSLAFSIIFILCQSLCSFYSPP